MGLLHFELVGIPLFCVGVAWPCPHQLLMTRGVEAAWFCLPWRKVGLV